MTLTPEALARLKQLLADFENPREGTITYMLEARDRLTLELHEYSAQFISAAETLATLRTLRPELESEVTRLESEQVECAKEMADCPPDPSCDLCADAKRVSEKFRKVLALLDEQRET